MSNRIQLRRGTAAAWAAANPVLAAGEPGYETDTGKEKIGNGLTAWNSLNYKPSVSILEVSTTNAGGLGMGVSTGDTFPVSPVDGDYFGLTTTGYLYKYVTDTWVIQKLGSMAVTIDMANFSPIHVDATHSQVFFTAFDTGRPLIVHLDVDSATKNQQVVFNHTNNNNGILILVQQWDANGKSRNTDLPLDFESSGGKVNVYSFDGPIELGYQYNADNLSGDWAPLGGITPVLIMPEVGCDGWGNDPELASDGALKRYTLNEQQYTTVGKQVTVVGNTTGFGIPMNGAVDAVEDLPPADSVSRQLYSVGGVNGTAFYSNGTTWVSTGLYPDNISNAPFYTDGATTVRIINDGTGDLDWLPVVHLRNDSPVGTHKVFVEMERDTYYLTTFLDVDATNKNKDNFAVICDNWTSQFQTVRQGGIVNSYILVPRGGATFVQNWRQDDFISWVPIDGNLATTFIGTNYSADGWGNDAKRSKNGFFERFSLTELEYAQCVAKKIDPATTGLGITYTAVGVADDLSDAPSHSNGIWIRTVSGYSARSQDGVWNFVYDSSADKTGYCINDLSLPPCTISKTNYGTFILEKASNASDGKYLAFFNFANTDMPDSTYRFSIYGHRNTQVSAYLVFDGINPTGFAPVGDARKHIAYHSGGMYIHYRDYCAGVLTYAGPRFTEGQVVNVLSSVETNNAQDGAWGNDAELDSSDFYRRYSLSETQYKFFGPGVENQISDDPDAIGSLPYTTILADKYRVLNLRSGAGQGNIIIDSALYVTGDILRFANTTNEEQTFVFKDNIGLFNNKNGEHVNDITSITVPAWSGDRDEAILITVTKTDGSYGTRHQWSINYNPALDNSQGSGKAYHTHQAGLESEPVVYTYSTSTYAAGTTYKAGAVVIYSGIPYGSKVSSNVGNQPDISPTYWRTLPDASVPAGDANHAYIVVETGEVWFAEDTTRDSYMLKAIVESDWLQLTADVSNYLYADRDTATWIVSTTLYLDSLRYLLYMEMFCRANSRSAHKQKVELAAHGDTESHFRRLLTTSDRYKRESGALLNLTCADTTLTIGLGGGGVYTVNHRYDMEAVTSATRIFKCELISGNWSYTSATGPTLYNNTQYNGPTGLTDLTDNYYGIMWLWRGIEDEDHFYAAFSQEQYATIDQAKAAKKLLIEPLLATSHAMAVGRIIFQKGQTTSLVCESAFDSVFAAASAVTDHGGLSGLADDDHTQYFNEARGDGRYVQKNTAITGATAVKVTYDSKGLITGSEAATASDVGLGNVNNTADADKNVASAGKSTNLVGGNNTTLLGSIPYQSNTDTTVFLTPNTTNIKKFLSMTGTGTNGAVPVYSTIVGADLPALGNAGLQFAYSTTVGGNPAVGTIRLGNGTLSTATLLHISETDAAGSTVDPILDLLVTIGSIIKLYDRVDPDNNYFWYKVTAGFASTGSPLYDPIPVTPLISKGTLADTASVDLVVYFLTPAIGANTQVPYNDNGQWGADANFTWDKTNKILSLPAGGLKQSTYSGTPTASAGELIRYTKAFGGKQFECHIDADAVEEQLQTSLAFRNIRMISPGSTSAAVGLNVTVTTSASTTTSVSPSTGSVLNSSRRITFATSTTAGNIATCRFPVADVWRGNAAGLGGFFFKARVFNAGTLQTGQRGFIGLWGAASAATNVDPTTDTNTAKIGMGFNSSTGNWFFITNSTGAITATDLGVNFPVSTSKLYEIILYCKPNDTIINVRITNITDNITWATTSVSSNLPSNTTFMAPQVWITNNAQAAASTIGITNMYLETAI